MQAATQLKIINFSPGVWHCDSGPNTYRITQKGGPGAGYSCTCPARVECKHIKFLKTGKQPEPTTKQLKLMTTQLETNTPPVLDATKTALDRLKAPFLPEEHKDRDLPGGGRWFFLPWQLIRKRVNEVDPCWTVSYTDPAIAGDYICVRCQLTVCGITREGMGNDKAYPDKKTYGTPIERAIADAFKNAAEQFGVGAYLDSQDFVVKYLQQHGDGRGYAYSDKSRENRAKQGLPPRKFS